MLTPLAPCDRLLRVQFITPVHYSICWALSTWIIESDASIINYIVHVHHPHLRVYSFTVKIHCVGTWHTRSYIENKLIYKYIFFSSLDSIFIKSYIFQLWFLWLLLPQQDHWWKKLSYVFTSSFSFRNKYLWNGCSFDSGRLGLGQSDLFEKNMRESRLGSPVNYGFHLLQAFPKQINKKTHKLSAALSLLLLILESSWGHELDGSLVSLRQVVQFLLCKE